MMSITKSKHKNNSDIQKDLLKLKILSLLRRKRFPHDKTKHPLQVYEMLDLPHNEKMFWTDPNRFLHLYSSEVRTEIINDNATTIFRIIDRNFTPSDLQDLCCLFGYRMGWDWQNGTIKENESEFQRYSALSCIRIICSESQSVVVCFGVYFLSRDKDSKLEPENTGFLHLLFLLSILAMDYVRNPIFDVTFISGLFYLAMASGLMSYFPLNQFSFQLDFLFRILLTLALSSEILSVMGRAIYDLEFSSFVFVFRRIGVLMLYLFLYGLLR